MNKNILEGHYHKETRLCEVQQAIDSLLEDVPSPKILEAGCGSASNYSFKSNSEIVGIDISQEQLDRNETLSRKILGDIQTYDLSKFTFDAIICNYVFEHLEHPEKALTNFVHGLADNGIIVIVAPNVLSLTGLIIKFTPFWSHKLARRIMAHNPVIRPFPTYHRLSMAPYRVKKLAARNGLATHYFRLYQSYWVWKLCQQSIFMKVVLTILRQLFQVLTLGKWDILLGTYTVIIGKVRDVTSI